MGRGARGGNGCGVSSQLGWPYQGELLCHHIISPGQIELALPHVTNTLVSTFTINSSPDYSMLSLCYLFLRFCLLMGIVNFERMNQGFATSPVTLLRCPPILSYLTDRNKERCFLLPPLTNSFSTALRQLTFLSICQTLFHIHKRTVRSHKDRGLYQFCSLMYP